MDNQWINAVVGDAEGAVAELSLMLTQIVLVHDMGRDLSPDSWRSLEIRLRCYATG